MHPRIARLYVNNYRCFVNFELRPQRRSLLLGYNGTGKSSVLDVLHSIRRLVVTNVSVDEAFPIDTLSRFAESSDQRFELDRLLVRVAQVFALDHEELGARHELRDLHAALAFDQHLHRAVRQAQQLDHLRDGADLVDVFGRGIVRLRLLLRGEHDLLVLTHRVFERLDRLLATDEERNDHVRENDDVP